MDDARATPPVLHRNRVDLLTAVCLFAIGLLVGLACSEWWPAAAPGPRAMAEAPSL